MVLRSNVGYMGARHEHRGKYREANPGVQIKLIGSCYASPRVLVWVMHLQNAAVQEIFCTQLDTCD